MAPAVKEARDPYFTASTTSTSGLPGSIVQVTFTHEPPPVINFRAAAPTTIRSCGFALDENTKPTDKCGGAALGATWTMAMPKDLEAGKHEVYWTVVYTEEGEAKSDTGVFTYTIVEPTFSTTVVPATANPGQPVDVRFAGERGVTIAGCSVQGIECGEDGDGWFARVPAPDTTSIVPWQVKYTDEQGTDHSAPGEVEIKVEPWPAPDFQVGLAGSVQVEPGAAVTVKFESRTTGVDVKTCFVTYRGGRVDCTSTGLATVMVSGDAAAGPAELPWELTFASSRRGEKGGQRTGSVGFAVVVAEPDFSVTVQPPAARPGDTVTLTFTSLVPGAEIVDCIAFFPHAVGDTCRRSPQRQVVRTRVPKDLPPGATLLRWGVMSTNATGRNGVDDDVIPYLILPPLPKTGPTTTRTTPSTEATTPPATGSTGTGGSTGQVGTIPAAAPEFVAETRPESAPPGARVTVVVSPARPGRADPRLHCRLLGRRRPSLPSLRWPLVGPGHRARRRGRRRNGAPGLAGEFRGHGGYPRRRQRHDRLPGAGLRAGRPGLRGGR